MLKGGYPEGSHIKGKLDKKANLVAFTLAKAKNDTNEEEPEEAETHEE